MQVAGLAVVSVLCFAASTSVALLTDIPVRHWLQILLLRLSLALSFLPHFKFYRSFFTTGI
jgi:hypothetical protein